MTSRGSIASQIAAVTTLALAWLVTPAVAQNAYITNSGDSTVSVIDTTTNTVSATINVGNKPFGVAVSSDGSKVYVTNAQDGTVSVIDTATNNPTTIPNVGNLPEGIAVTPDGKKVYVANQADFTVAVIDAATNTVSTVISVGAAPFGVAVTPDGSKVYVTNSNNGVSVIATASNTVIATMPTGVAPRGVAVSPDGKKVYVGFFQEISDENPPIFLPLLGIYDTATNTVLGQIQLAFDHGPDTPFGVAVTPDGSKVYVASITNVSCCVFAVDATGVATIFNMGGLPAGVSVTPDGKKAYVANLADGTVSVIDTATNNVTKIIPNVGSFPSAFGIFIQPRFAGTAGSPSCFGTTVGVLTKQNGGLPTAAKVLGFSNVAALQKAITAFCGS